MFLVSITYIIRMVGNHKGKMSGMRTIRKKMHLVFLKANNYSERYPWASQFSLEEQEVFPFCPVFDYEDPYLRI